MLRSFLKLVRCIGNFINKNISNLIQQLNIFFYKNINKFIERLNTFFTKDVKNLNLWDFNENFLVNFRALHSRFEKRMLSFTKRFNDRIDNFVLNRDEFNPLHTFLALLVYITDHMIELLVLFSMCFCVFVYYLHIEDYIIQQLMYGWHTVLGLYMQFISFYDLIADFINLMFFRFELFFSKYADYTYIYNLNFYITKIIFLFMYCLNLFFNFWWNLDIIGIWHFVIYSTFNFYFLISVTVLFIATLTIWTRAAGPRVRLDQLSKLTWKELIFIIFMILFILLFLFIYF